MEIPLRYILPSKIALGLLQMTEKVYIDTKHSFIKLLRLYLFSTKFRLNYFLPYSSIYTISRVMSGLDTKYFDTSQIEFNRETQTKGNAFPHLRN